VVKNVELDMDATDGYVTTMLIDNRKDTEEENHYMPMLWRSV
jgi:hypothetical protein